MKSECFFCERVPFCSYNSLDACLYSEKAVLDLTNGAKYKTFCRHKKWVAAFSFLRFFTAFLITVVIFYCWVFTERDVLASEHGSNHGMFQHILVHIQVKYSFSGHLPFMRFMTIGCVVYLLPASLLLSFVKSFDANQQSGSIVFYFCWTLIHFILSEYNRRTERATENYTSTDPVFVAFWDSIAVQGYIVASSFVVRWVSARWDNAWFIWCPILTFPLLVGISGVGFRYLLHAFIIYLSSSSLGSVGLFHILERSVGLPSSIINVYWRLLLSYGRVGTYPERIFSIRKLIHFPAYGFYEVIDDSHTFYCAFLCTIVCFLVSFIVPILAKQANWFISCLPDHPSAWGILFIGGLSSLIMCCTLWPCAFLLNGFWFLALFSLLYNGFVA